MNFASRRFTALPNVGSESNASPNPKPKFMLHTNNSQTPSVWKSHKLTDTTSQTQAQNAPQNSDPTAHSITFLTRLGPLSCGVARRVMRTVGAAMDEQSQSVLRCVGACSPCGEGLLGRTTPETVIIYEGYRCSAMECT